MEATDLYTHILLNGVWRIRYTFFDICYTYVNASVMLHLFYCQPHTPVFSFFPVLSSFFPCILP